MIYLYLSIGLQLVFCVFWAAERQLYALAIQAVGVVVMCLVLIHIKLTEILDRMEIHNRRKQ